MTQQQALALALQHHQSGKLAEAETLYREILATQPSHADALHLLGVVAHQRGRPKSGAASIRQSLALQPDNAVAHSNLGEVYRYLGQLDEAISAFQRAIELQPDYVAAYFNLGNALREHGKQEEAIAAYGRALELKPDHAESHNNLGVALAAAGRVKEAISAYRRALELRPQYPEAHHNLANALQEQGQWAAALAAYGRAIESNPLFAEAFNSMGAALADRNRFDDAILAYRRALELNRNLAAAWNNLGAALAARGDSKEAIDACRRAYKLRPDYPEAHYNMANAQKQRGQCDEAILTYHFALAFRPEYAEAHNNLGIALAERGELPEAIARCRQAVELKPHDPAILGNLIFALQFDPAGEAEAVGAEQERWNRIFVAPRKAAWVPHQNQRDPGRRLKIGYVSADFCFHAASFFFTPLLEAHDHQQFEIHCYADVRRSDAITERLRRSADVWREVNSLSDAELAAGIRADGIDILIDLAMHAAGNRLPAFAQHPAPVQISWLAYPGSTGVEAIDARLSDAHIDPLEGRTATARELVLRLPDSWCCYQPIREFPTVGELPAARNGFVTFGSINQFRKIHEGLLDWWARLLQAVPQSRLLIVGPVGLAKKRTYAFFSERGIATERVEWVPLCHWPEYVRLFERIDIALDSFPCNGMTTTCHSLWMGVPVVTLTGSRAMSRAGNSLLHTAGLPEWIAQDEGGYVEIAARWAADLSRLTALRAGLRARMTSSPLMDAPRFARNIEAAYRAMWQRWCETPTSTR